MPEVLPSPLLAAFDAHVAARPAATAVHYPQATDSRPLDYRALARRVTDLAADLTARGVVAGDAVGVFFEPEPSLVVAMLAVHRLGAVYVMLDPALPLQRLHDTVEDCPLAAVLGPVPRGFTGRVGHAGVDASADDALALCFTSGSTGVPKAAVIRAGSVAHLVQNVPEVRLRADDRMAQVNNPAFDALTWEVWAAVTSGACLVGHRRDVLADARELGPFLTDNGITTLFLTTSVFNAHAHTGILDHLRLLVFGGEVANVGALRAARPHLPELLVHVYGPTETTVYATCHLVDDITPEQTQLPIGRPLPGYTTVVWHDEQRPALPGEPGELLVGGVGVAAGYLRRPQLTAEKFGPHPAGTGYYRTGDVVVADDEGLLYFRGRIDHQVKVRGHRIELEEIETRLRTLPGVREALVCPVRDRDSLRLIAVVTAERVATDWQETYDELYRGIDLTDDADRLRGWHDTAGHQPIPREQMLHWRRSTVERIAALGPRRVLEIGVGSGLLLEELAPGVDSFLGTDFAGEVIDRLTHRYAADPHVRLEQREAADLRDLAAGEFDTIVLNSVVQYFPDADYLVDLLASLLRLLAPGGRIFVGDVRDLRLLERFHAELGGARTETELLLAPEFFTRIPGVGTVDVLPKRGRHHNELTRYRFDVVLGAEAPPTPGAPDETGTRAERAVDVPWRELVDSLPGRTAEVVTAGGIPDDRFHAGGWSVEDLYDVGAAANRATTVTTDREPGYLRAWFASGASVTGTQPPAEGPAEAYANVPAGGRLLALQLTRELAATLPAYMVPSAVIVRDSLPRNPNGKIDRGAVADIAAAHDRAAAAPPTSFREAVVRSVFAAELGLDERTVAANDDFFDLGGHSLAAVRFARNLGERLGLDIATADIYRGRTSRGITDHVYADRPAQPVQADDAAHAPGGYDVAEPPEPDQGDLTRAAAVVALARLAGTDTVIVRLAVTPRAAVITTRVRVDPTGSLRDVGHDLVRAESRALLGEARPPDAAPESSTLPAVRYGPHHLTWWAGEDATVTVPEVSAGMRRLLARPDTPVVRVDLTSNAHDHEPMAAHTVLMDSAALTGLLPHGVRLTTPATDGRAVPVYVLDDGARPARAGEVGVLYVPHDVVELESPAVDAVVADPLRAGVMVRTGVAARWHPDGVTSLGREAPGVFDDELETFVVLTDPAGRRSLWPSRLAVPSGWTPDSVPTAREAALDQMQRGAMTAGGTVA